MDAMLLRRIPIFDELDMDELTAIAPLLSSRRLNPGDVVFREGAHGNAMCFVHDGELEVSKQSANGAKQVITRLTDGQSAGEMSLIDGLIRSATVTASKPSLVLVMKRDDFYRFMREQPAIGIKVMKGVARLLSINLRKTSQDLTALMMSLA